MSQILRALALTLTMITVAPAFAADCNTELTQGVSRGFARAMELEVGDSVFAITKPIKSETDESLEFARAGVIESITRDHRFVVSFGQKKSVLVDWRHIAVESDYANFQLGQKLNHRSFLNVIEPTVFRGYTLDESRFVIETPPSLRALAGAGDSVLYLASATSILDLQVGEQQLPRDAYLFMGAEVKKISILKINDSDVTISDGNTESVVDLSDIAEQTSLFKPDQKVILENTNGTFDYGFIVAQTPAGDLIYSNEKHTFYKIVHPSRVNKLKREKTAGTPLPTPKSGAFMATELRPAVVTSEVQKFKLQELIDSGVLEESLSMEEYPDLEVTQAGNSFRITIGASSYGTADGDVIQYETQNDQIDLLNKKAISITTPSGEFFMLVFSRYNDGTGKMICEVVLKHQGDDGEPATDVALFSNAKMTPPGAGLFGKKE